MQIRFDLTPKLSIIQTSSNRPITPNNTLTIDGIDIPGLTING
ncbi:hypothetical protein [Nostoc sp. PA-18-2419]|nr:hypothetical protein [Nostoc sp. PA-18-2419]